jgi:hypothetical protein
VEHDPESRVSRPRVRMKPDVRHRR